MKAFDAISGIQLFEMMPKRFKKSVTSFYLFCADISNALELTALYYILDWNGISFEFKHAIYWLCASAAFNAARSVWHNAKHINGQ